MKKFSIIAPCYNEEANIEPFYAAILDVFTKIPQYDFEIICIDDGSSDLSLQKLLEIHEKDQRVHIVEFSRNFGKEAALSAGIDVARGDAVIPIDMDLQHPPELILQFVQKWKQGAEVVLARRTDRDTDSFLRKTTSEMFYKLHNKLSSVQIPKNVGDYRLMDKAVVEALKRLPEKQRFMKGLFAWCGFKTEIVDYECAPRTAGTSKFSGWKLWNFALEGITSFSSTPLTFWLYFGILMFFCSAIYALYTIIDVLLFGVSVPGYASLLVAIIAIGGLQFIGIGLLGEYIGRIYMEAKNRPIYIIRKHHTK